MPHMLVEKLHVFVSLQKVYRERGVCVGKDIAPLEQNLTCDASDIKQKEYIGRRFC
jgi:hypothetical protein